MNLWNKKFLNPLGLAAGYDKNGESIESILDLGFGFMEIGSITPEPQLGNSLPRVFRLINDKAVINRYGFNSDGHLKVKKRLQKLIKDPNKLLGINLGKNKTSDDAIKDYILGIERLGEFADFLIINVSSPNTPGLRSLQRREVLQDLLMNIQKSRDLNCKNIPLLVKIAPDVTDQEILDIASVIKKLQIDGIIIGNTTISRPNTLKDIKIANEIGGLSGKPLKSLTLDKVKKFYIATNGSIPIIGCGGISTAEDVIEYGKAGASLIELYTGMIFEGPGIVTNIKQELLEKLEGKKWKDIIGENVELER
jgi:dihydroorotate dehydrogenase